MEKAMEAIRSFLEKNYIGKFVVALSDYNETIVIKTDANILLRIRYDADFGTWFVLEAFTNIEMIVDIAKILEVHIP